MSGTSHKIKQAQRFFNKGEVNRANTLLEKLLKKNPRDFDACFLLGAIASKQNMYDRAFFYFSRAVNIRKNSARAALQLGLVCKAKSNSAAAIKHIQHALKMKPDYLEAYDTLTQVLQLEGQYHEMVEACRKGVSYFPKAVDLFARLAGGLEQTSQLDDAWKVTEQLLQLQPEHPRGLLTQAKIAKRRGDLKQASNYLLIALKQKLHPAQFSAIAGEHGEVLDRLGDFNGAFNAFKQANEALLRAASPQLINQNTIPRKIANYPHFFSNKNTAAWADETFDDNIQSPVFLVGFPRSGTTLTEQILTSSGSFHPSDEQPFISQLISQIDSILGKHISFPDGLNNLNNEEICLIRKAYWAIIYEMYGTIDKGSQFLDKLPLNIIELGFIHRIFPQAKIIVVLRDPRDCCLSSFMRQFVLNEAMINFTSLPRTAEFYESVMGLWLHYREQLKLNYLQVRYEDLVVDLEKEARKILNFLDAPWNEEVLRFYNKVQERNVRTPSYGAIASPVYSRAVGRWQNYKTHLEPVMNRLNIYISSFGYN